MAGMHDSKQLTFWLEQEAEKAHILNPKHKAEKAIRRQQKYLKPKVFPQKHSFSSRAALKTTDFPQTVQETRNRVFKYRRL